MQCNHLGTSRCPHKATSHNRLWAARHAPCVLQRHSGVRSADVFGWRCNKATSSPLTRTGLVPGTGLSCRAAGAGPQGSDNPGISAVQQQLAELKAEIDKLSIKIDAAYEAIEKADTDGLRSLRLERYKVLVAEKERLDTMRRELQTQLNPGITTSVPVNQLPSPNVVQGLLEFAQAVLEADPDADFIKLPRLSRALPRALRRSIMVRQCYRDVVQLIMEVNEGKAAGISTLEDSGFAFVLTGTPGIGKSALALYLICILAQQRQKLVYRYYHDVYGDTLVLLDFTDPSDIKVDCASALAGGMDRLAGHVRDDPCTWLLVDGSAPPTQFGEAGRMVIMTSPNAGNYSQFTKASAVEELWLPVWSLEEMERCHAELYPWVDAGTMKERYTYFGGLVRFVLAKPTYPFAKLMQKLSRADADRLIHLDMEDTRSDVRHSLAHAQVDGDFNFLHYALGSPMIIEEVAEKAEYSMRTLTADLMLAESERPGSKAFAIMLGEMLERYVHKLLVAGWYLDPSNIWQLQPAPRQAPAITHTQFTAAQTSAALAAGWEHHWDDGQDLHQVEGYFQPRSSNQAGYDSFINTKGFTIIIQVTRDPNHQVNTEAIMSLLARLPASKPACILFVLPEHPAALAQHYRYQSWTMEMPTGGKTKNGKDKLKRRVVTDSELPVKVHGLEQWVTPFPLFLGGTSSSTAPNVGTSSDTEA